MGSVHIPTLSTGALVFAVGTTGDKVQLLNGGVLSIDLGMLKFGDFAFNAAPGLSNGTYTLFDSSLPIDGTFGPSRSEDFGAFNGALSFGDNGHDITLTVVPEPGTAMLLLAGLGLLARRRRVV